MNPEAQNTPEKLDQVVTVVCDACAADMTWDTESQSLKCGHCGNTRELPKQSDMIVEQDFSEALSLKDQPTGYGIATHVFHCESCGAETAVEQSQVEVECPFCGSQNVNEKAHAEKVISPQGIMPFKIAKKEALDKFKGWIKKGWFHPNKLKTLAALEKIAGIYLPFWTYDAFTQSNWTADAGYYYYVTESYTDSDGNSQTRQVQKVRWVPASGYYEHFFDDVLVVGSKGVSQQMVEKIYPYQLAEVVNYDPKFILGWKSEVYQKDVKQAYGVADKIMDGEIRTACGRQVPGDTHRNLNVHTQKSKITFKHILLPLWIAAYKFKGKAFQFVVNGQTGKIGGDKPLSWIKITLAVLLAIAVGVGIYFLVQYINEVPPAV